MNTATATRLAPSTIPLWTPPHRRWLEALAPLVDRLHDALARRAARRAARRSARAQAQLLATLDASTLRDIGLGDWSALARDADTTASWLHERELHRY